MAAAKSPKKKSKHDHRFVTVYMGPVGGEMSTAILDVPDPLPKKMSAVFRYLNEARYLRNQQKVVLDFFREAQAGMTKEELALVSRRVKENWDNMDRVSVISETGSNQPEGSGRQCLVERMRKIKKVVSEEVNQLKRKLAVNSPSHRSRGPSPARKPMDLVSFAVKYDNKIKKIDALLDAYMEVLDAFQKEMATFPQAEEESIFYIDFRDRAHDAVHHKMTIHEGLVKRVETISLAAVLILKKTAKISVKLQEHNPDLYEALEERKRAVPKFRTLQPQ